MGDGTELTPLQTAKAKWKREYAAAGIPPGAETRDWIGDLDLVEERCNFTVAEMKALMEAKIHFTILPTNSTNQ